MKILNILVLSQAETDTGIFKNTIATFSDFNVKYTTDIEIALEATNAHLYDLLIIDNNFDKEAKTKLEKLIALIYPESATLDLHFNDEFFIRFKLEQMQNKWIAANSATTFQFMDNPNLK